nr:phage regulatory CII family protein [Brucella anthropi]
MRTISEQEQRSLKLATDGAYILAGGISNILPFTRVGTSTLSKYASESDDFRENFIPIDVAIEVDRRAKSPLIIRNAAALLGYELVPAQSQSSNSSPRAPITEIDAHRVMKETMDVAQAIIEARKDDRIDAADRKIILKEAREAIRELERLVLGLEVEA